MPRQFSYKETLVVPIEPIVPSSRNVSPRSEKLQIARIFLFVKISFHQSKKPNDSRGSRTEKVRTKSSRLRIDLCKDLNVDANKQSHVA